eukprot:7379374-Lingulodinium_polyedra.AAC.1
MPAPPAGKGNSDRRHQAKFLASRWPCGSPGPNKACSRLQADVRGSGCCQTTGVWGETPSHGEGMWRNER